LIALFGSPNSGKTSLFNCLTGGREKVGNYPGVTVEKAVGKISLPSGEVDIVDVPGLYSLRTISHDEEVAKEALLGKSRPDLMIFVLDAVNLERSLFLYSQVAEGDGPVIAALTMTDLAEKEGKTIDTVELSRRVGSPVVPVIAHKKIGVDELIAAAEAQMGEGGPEFDLGYPRIVSDAVADLSIDPAMPDIEPEEIRAQLLEDDAEGSPEWKAALAKARDELFASGIQAKTLDTQTRYAWASSCVKACVETKGQLDKTRSQKLDEILTHKVWGLGVFLAIMYAGFYSIYALAIPLMDLIEAAVGAAGSFVSPLITYNDALRSLVVDGVIGGVGAALVFLPQILILFVFIGILEGTGYLARASFMMDKLLGWCGLNGRAFIPLLSSFACAVPGIMAARVMPEPKARLATIMVAPLMSCSARLPVYVLLIGAIIEPKFGTGWAAFALFAMHFVGLIFAVPVAWILSRKILKGRRVPFTLELPRIQLPKWRDIWVLVMTRGRIFLKTAGTIIFFMSIAIWWLSYFPRSVEATQAYELEYSQMPYVEGETIGFDAYVERRQSEESYLGRLGKGLEPVFKPAGFDWRITTAILAAFPAREVVVSAMGILFSHGPDEAEDSQTLRDAIANATWPDGKPLLNIWNAMGLMVFFALCAQCMATLATIKREAGSWQWAGAAFAYMTLLAYICAVFLNKVGAAFG
jgi:ferrous iron transport protein B